MNNAEKALALHKEWNGKINTTAKCQVKTREDLAIAYTPGVAEPCKVIAKNKEEAYLGLKELSNSKCTAYTGITLIDLYKEKTICSSSKADVYFNEIKDEEIEWYVNNEEKIFKCCGFVPLGKASLFIDKIEGDYNTLLGISPSIIYNKLKELGYSVTDLDFEKRK